MKTQPSKPDRGLGMAILAAAATLIAPVAWAQSSFVDLDFESAVVPNVPSGQPISLALTNMLPGWTGYIGTNLVAFGLYNGLSVGGAEISLIDGHTSYDSNGVIGLYFTVALQAGNVTPPPLYGSASIAQTGLFPANAHSLLFNASGSVGYTSNFFVTIGGLSVPFTKLGTGPNFTQYGADISAFAGQTAELRFTSEPGSSNPFTIVYLDDIQFSSSSIPEPGASALFGVGALLLSCSFRRGFKWRRYEPRVRARWLSVLPAGSST